MYSLFYTVYSLPNIALPFFGGIFVDRFGARVCLIAFTMFLLVGQVRAYVFIRKWFWDRGCLGGWMDGRSL